MIEITKDKDGKVKVAATPENEMTPFKWIESRDSFQTLTEELSHSESINVIKNLALVTEQEALKYFTDILNKALDNHLNK